MQHWVGDGGGSVLERLDDDGEPWGGGGAKSRDSSLNTTLNMQHACPSAGPPEPLDPAHWWELICVVQPYIDASFQLTQLTQMFKHSIYKEVERINSMTLFVDVPLQKYIHIHMRTLMSSGEAVP